MDDDGSSARSDADGSLHGTRSAGSNGASRKKLIALWVVAIMAVAGIVTVFAVTQKNAAATPYDPSYPYSSYSYPYSYSYYPYSYSPYSYTSFSYYPYSYSTYSPYSYSPYSYSPYSYY